MNWKNQVTENYETISKYNVLGLRSACPDEKYSIGDTARNSYDWDMENDCSSDDELNGASAIAIDNSWLEGADDLIERIENAIDDAKSYHGGKHIVLLGGWSSDYGTDSGERVIANAKVLAVIK
jgi:hypothetical protein